MDDSRSLEFVEECERVERKRQQTLRWADVPLCCVCGAELHGFSIACGACGPCEGRRSMIDLDGFILAQEAERGVDIARMTAAQQAEYAQGIVDMRATAQRAREQFAPLTDSEIRDYDHEADEAIARMERREESL